MYNQGLPVSADVLQYQPLNISLNNIPYVPNVQMSNPHLQQILPLVSGAVIMEINGKAQNNPLRRFMFNLCVQNNFCNRDVDTIIMATMDALELEAFKRNASYDSLVQYVAPMMVELFCANNVRQYPELGNYVPQDIQRDIANSIGMFDNLSNEVRNFKSQQQMGGYRNQQQSNWGGGQQWQQPRAGYQTQGGGRPVGGGSVFYSGNQAPAANARDERFDRYSANVQQQQPQPVVQQQTVNKEAQVEEQPTTDFLGETHMNMWRPTANFPYLPVYNPSERTLWFRKNPDGSVSPYFVPVEKNVDYDRHNIQTVFGPVPRVITLDDTAEVFQEVGKALKSMGAENESLAKHDFDSEEPVPVTPHIHPSRYIDLSLDTVWFNALMDRIGVDDGKTPYLYRALAQVAEPTISGKDETEYVRDLASAKTFIELREKMKGSADEVTKELWMVCHRKATAMINRLVRNNLSLPGLSIESFVDDIEDLLNIIERKYGIMVREALEKRQKENIRAAFNLFDETIASGMTNDMIGDRKLPDGFTPHVTYLASDVSLTVIDCMATELGVQLPVDFAGALTKDGSPMMYNLAVELFSSLKDQPGKFERHYIRTLDHRTLELTEGYLGEGFYMLSLVE